MTSQLIGRTLTQTPSHLRKGFERSRYGKRAGHGRTGDRKQPACAHSAPLLPALALALAFAWLAGCSSRTAAPEARYVPAGDLLDIVKDFQRLAKEDTYRFPIPKDITGINIMKATLVRLSDNGRAVFRAYVSRMKTVLNNLDVD